LCALVVADGGEDMKKQVLEDFRIIGDVHLPLSWQGLGVRSGERLRVLKAQALADHVRSRTNRSAPSLSRGLPK
jgi:hypothetical protein